MLMRISLRNLYTATSPEWQPTAIWPDDEKGEVEEDDDGENDDDDGDGDDGGDDDDDDGGSLTRIRRVRC